MWLCRKLAPSQLFTASAGTTLYCVHSIIDIHIFSHPSLFASSLSPLLLELEEFSKSETSRESGDRVSNLGLPYCSTTFELRPSFEFCELRRTTFELHIRRWSYATAWTTVHSIELRHILSNYAALFRATPYTIMSFVALFWATPHPSEIRRIILSYPEAPFWATLHPFELRCTLLSYSICNLTMSDYCIFTIVWVYPSIVRLQHNCTVACHKVVFFIHLTALLIPNMHFRLASNAINLLCIHIEFIMGKMV